MTRNHGRAWLVAVVWPAFVVGFVAAASASDDDAPATPPSATPSDPVPAETAGDDDAKPDDAKPEPATEEAPPDPEESRRIDEQIARILTQNRRDPGVNALQILKSRKLQQELQLTPQQLEKLQEIDDAFSKSLTGIALPPNEIRNLSREERLKKVAELRTKIDELGRQAGRQALGILQPKQQRRLREVLLQRQGLSALEDPDVAKALKLTKPQQKRFAEAAEAVVAERRDLLQAVRAGKIERTAAPAKLKAIEVAYDEKIQSILTPAQRRLYEKLLGARFEFEPPPQPPEPDPAEQKSERP